MRDRYRAKTLELGVSERTLERWVAGYRDAGPAGLVDSRLLGKYASGVDPRWDAACLAVLKDLTDASTPTMNVVIARVAREVEAEHGADVVSLPTRTTAYRRIKQLAKGRYSFGSGKDRRSVAERPQGVYGRLRATRPGEYVVLDTTPLDVFAMEPVTLRWVPVELTVAMDPYTRCILGLRLTPVSTRSHDVANVLYQSARYNLATKQGRDAFVHARAPLQQLSRAEMAQLSSEEMEDYNDARGVWNANPPTVQTAQFSRAYGVMDQVMASNRRDSDNLRGAVVIDAAPALGKTTIATRYARDFHRKTIRRLGSRTPDGHQRLPVAYVPLAAGTTLKGLNLKLAAFVGLHLPVTCTLQAVCHSRQRDTVDSDWARDASRPS